jgi:hypothetical protein
VKNLWSKVRKSLRHPARYSGDGVLPYTQKNKKTPSATNQALGGRVKRRKTADVLLPSTAPSHYPRIHNPDPVELAANRWRHVVTLELTNKQTGFDRNLHCTPWMVSSEFTEENIPYEKSPGVNRTLRMVPLSGLRHLTTGM